jgi:type I restriction enzyme S subunit
MKLKPYPVYKFSGVEWLGKVPDGWTVTKVKHVTSFTTGWTPPTGDSASFEGDNLWANISDLGPKILNDTSKRVSNEAIKRSNITVSPKGSLLFSFKLSIGQVGIAGCDLYTNEAIATFLPDNEARLDYLYYASPIFIVENTSFNIYGAKLLNQELINAASIALPNQDEQRQIATFLDRETSKLDTLISKQEHLIELLQEKRQSIISHAVTRGLNPDAKMKDSNLDWLGTIPVNWETLPTKQIFKLIVDPAENDNDFELLSIYTDIGVRPRKELEAKGNKATTTDGYFRVKKNDFIVNKLLAWMGAIGLSIYDGVTSPAYDILRAHKKIDPRYYNYLFRCGVMFIQFKKYSRGIMDMRLRLYFEEFGQLHLPFPPESEQMIIANFLDEESRKIDSLIDKAIRSIDLAKEHRTALISAVVTGKIDVRDFEGELETA